MQSTNRGKKIKPIIFVTLQGWKMVIKDHYNKVYLKNIEKERREMEGKTFSGLPMIVETAVVASEKMGSVSTPSKLRLVVM